MNIKITALPQVLGGMKRWNYHLWKVNMNIPLFWLFISWLFLSSYKKKVINKALPREGYARLKFLREKIKIKLEINKN